MSRFVQHEDFGIGTVVSDLGRLRVRFESGMTESFPLESPEITFVTFIYPLRDRTNQITAGACDGCGEQSALVGWTRAGSRKRVALCSQCEEASLTADLFPDDIMDSGRVVDGSLGGGKRR